MPGATGNPSGGTLGEQIKSQAGIIPASQAAATVNGPVVNRLAFNVAALLCQGGAALGTPTTQAADFKVQHGTLADGSDMADATAGAFGGVAIAQQVADNFAVELEVDLRSLNQYIRVVNTVAFTGGSTPTWPVSCALTLGANVEEYKQ